MDNRSNPVAVEKRNVSFICLESNLNPSVVQALAQRMIHLFNVCKRLSIYHATQQLMM
jgi:hypothetical protein